MVCKPCDSGFQLSVPVLDLSGYSDMAIAVGSVMGYTVPENFRKPWAAASFTQFWRNWHITLSDWVREHIFVVLNGKNSENLLQPEWAFL